MSTIALGTTLQADIAAEIPVHLSIPPRPRPRHAWPASVTREPAWREAMRWSLLALTASLAAGEVALALFGP
ncbi:hypothetical protein [Falsiroseomonas sp. E2-1-a4]|uniref:hypothetical protein n=1 Tax=Falsiroseomonas sp. E2-1-a4 TaxID=3239299 RepID=UPI003F3E5AF6